MVIEIVLVLFLLGLVIGSFVNAFVWRFHEGTLRSILSGRSRCVHCKRELAARDLVPVISYIALKGRCRYCRKPIDDKPWAELATPLLFVVSYLFWPSGFSGAGLFSFCLWLVFLAGFVALALIDIRWYELPHEIVFWLVCLATGQAAVIAVFYEGGLSRILSAFGGAAVVGGLFALLYRISPKASDAGEEEGGGQAGIGSAVFGILLGWLLGGRSSKWIGGGDITLGILLGLLAGSPALGLLLIFMASLIGTAVALPLLLTGRATRSSHLPFGPFLLAGAVAVKLFGSALISWYANNLLA